MVGCVAGKRVALFWGDERERQKTRGWEWNKGGQGQGGSDAVRGWGELFEKVFFRLH